MEIAVPRLIAFKTIQKMRIQRDCEAKIREKQFEHLKLFGGTQLSQSSYKQTEQANNSTYNVNASGTKNSFGLQQPKLQSKTSKIEVKV